MREARIIMPLVSTDSRHVREHDRLKRALAQNFGGYTVTYGSGGWVNGQGNLVVETVAIYDVAMPDTKANRVRVRDLAYLAAVELKQESVYVRTPDGNVHIDNVAHTKDAPAYRRELTPAELAGTIAPPPHEQTMFDTQREAQGIREVDYLPER